MKNLYLVFTLVFLTLSLAGGVFLVQKNQENRNLATGCQCYPDDTEHCAGTTFAKYGPGCTSNSGNYIICSGTKSCTPEEMPTPASGCIRDQCEIGSQICHGAPNNQSGYQCNCVCATNPATGQSNVSVWSCGTYNPTVCTPKDGTLTGATECPSYPNVLKDGKCLTAKTGTLDVVVKYTCPPGTNTSQGCQQNPVVLRNQQSVCLDSPLCGVQQIDYGSGGGCFVSAVGTDCSPTTVVRNTPTVTPTISPSIRPSLTPTGTRTPTPTITKKPTPTATGTIRPTNTIKPTNTTAPTATGTIKPTNTTAPTATGTIQPTNTPQPTSTPTSLVSNTPTIIPTSVIAEGPSPTRIILPQAGFEFPIQVLSILGVIVTLAGFLILL